MANVAVVDTSPVAMLKTLPGWESLNRRDQISVEKDTKALGDAFQTMGRSRLAAAEHLTSIHEKMRRGMFSKYLAIFHIKRSWAFATMKAYKNTVQWLPEPVIKVAMQRNMPILGSDDDKPLGVYTNVVKRLPPPETDDPNEINQYLDTLEGSRLRERARASKKIAVVEADFDVVTMEAYRYASLRLQRLPSKSRRRFVEMLAGVLLTEIGVASAQTFEPEAIPDGYRAQVGRPRRQDTEVA